MKWPVIDLHCDLLSYLEISEKRSAFDRVVHCSIPQLKEGNVKLQVMAVFTQTGQNSIESAQKQIDIYKKLDQNYAGDFQPYQLKTCPQIQTLLAIENASGLWDEQDSFSLGLKRLHSLFQSNYRPLYIGMTWHTENRFGGGNSSKVGLKEDGKRLLEELNQQNIAIDLSHTSDALADGILDYIEYKNLTIPILASHSNAREICPHPRNLPDTLAKEIIKRKGVIGLNFYKNFIGQHENDMIRHVEHWLELGGEHAISLGADFFYEGDLSSIAMTKLQPYFSEFDSAACYQKLLNKMQKMIGLSENQLLAFASLNAEKFITQCLQKK